MRESVECDPPDGVERGEQIPEVELKQIIVPPPEGNKGRKENEGKVNTNISDLHCLFGGKAVDAAALRYDDERPLVRVVRVDVADGRRHELLRKVAEPTGKVIS